MVAELSKPARKVVYTIRHVVRDQLLDDSLASHHAQGLVVQPLTGVSTEEAYEALREALNSEVELSRWEGDPRYERPIAEKDFRAHLGRVVEQLDALRPWTVPLVRPLDPTLEWDPTVEWREVGAIRVSVPRLEDRVHNHLMPMAGPGLERQVRVAALELRSGRRIALVGRWWPDAPDVAAVLTRDPDVSASDVMAELLSEGHFEPGEYEVLT